MFGKLNKIKDELGTLKDLQSKLSGLDLQNPEKMMEQLGIDKDELEKQFMEQYDTKIELRYAYKSVNEEPKYHYGSDSGFDIRANETVHIGPLERKLVHTGLYLDVPPRSEVQIRPKSGLALKKGLTVLNTPGTIDEGYTGEIKVILINMDNITHTIEHGDKIAQAVLCPVVQGRDIVLKRVTQINEKDRNENGFGSTGN